MRNDETALVKCDTSKGRFTIKFIRKWSPLGYDRAVELFERGFYDNSHLFRVIPGFLVQFGITYTNDQELKKFAKKTIPDDPKIPELRRFRPGLVSYAGGGDNSRDAQLFISYGSAQSLGTMPWETPVGEVIEGMKETVEKLNSEYEEKPQQHRIHTGRNYIETKFPNMDSFKTCTVKRTKLGAAETVESAPEKEAMAEEPDVVAKDEEKVQEEKEARQVIFDEKSNSVQRSIPASSARLGSKASFQSSIENTTIFLSAL
uniref:PPIase cyclophilin-type domain-containing protein n=2 Tax=Odontella aurita TaxID=265563 RepID=A0A7S4N551_9STRA|mmetsp:Transcript_48166/g.145503  ORF Transcript_48166/g.145503 Transcript_48166/m.145503 type:complete len:260 (+) Transcript_48166:194-973(+)